MKLTDNALKEEIDGIEVLIQELIKEGKRRYREVQDFRVSVEKTNTYIKWQSKANSRIKSLKRKKQELCRKLS